MKRFLLIAALVGLLASPAALACGGMDAGMKEGDGHECPASMKGVERTVTNLDNGVRIQMTSADPALVQTLQAKITSDAKTVGCCGSCILANAAWTRKVESNEKGVVLTLTANSPAEVGKLQAAAVDLAKGGCSHEATAGKGECPHKSGPKATKA